MKSLVRRLLREEQGSTAIEYGMIVAAVALVIVSAVNLLGQNVNTTFFQKVASSL